MRFSPRLFFIRHGETDWNREGVLQGQRDIELNAYGRTQSQLAGRRLLHFLGDEASPTLSGWRLYASPMSRTRETMEIVRVALGVPAKPYTLDERLKELTFGRWEGRSWQQVQLEEPQAAKDRARDKWSFIPPEGESYQMLSNRVADWLQTVEGECLVVAHGGVARALMHLIGGVDKSKAPRIEIIQGVPILFSSGTYTWVDGAI